MDDWIRSWAHPDCHGGLPQCQAEDLLNDFWMDWETAECLDTEFCGGKEDLSKCFDHVSPEVSIRTLQLLGIDPGVAHVIMEFYGDLTSYFMMKGVVDPNCVQRINGLLQGCPFSMVILAAIMSCHLHYVNTKDSKCRTCVDDRLFNSNSLEGFAVMVRQTLYFDKAMGWKVNAKKGAVFVKKDQTNAIVHETAQAIGGWSNVIVQLGVELDIINGVNANAQQPQIRQPAFAKAREQIDTLNRGTHDKVQRARIIRSDILPKISWGSQWNAADAKLIADMEYKIEQSLAKVHSGRSRVMTWNTLLNAELNPRFCADYEVLRAHQRRLYRHAVGAKISGCNFGTSRLQDVLDCWKWTPVRDGYQGNLTEFRTPLGIIDLGRDSAATIRRYAIHAWSIHNMRTDNRMKVVADSVASNPHSSVRCPCE